MQFLNRLSISTRLLLIGLVPTLALIYYLQDYLRSEYKLKNETQELINNVSASETMSDLIHELQKERAQCLTFLTSPTEPDKNELIKQQEQTQKIVNLLRLGAPVKLVTDFPKNIERLPVIRNSMFNHSITLDETGLYYNNLKSELLLEIQSLLEKQADPEIRNLVNEILFMAYTNDFMAQVRSLLGLALKSGGNMNVKLYIEIISTYGKMNINLEKYLKTAKTKLKSEFEIQYLKPIHPGISATIDSVIYSRDIFIKNASYADCLHRLTNAVNELKNMEEKYFETIKLRAKNNNEEAISNFIKSMFFASFILLALILLITGTIRGITFSVNTLIDAAEKITQGKTSVDINISNRDEIGLLAESFKKLILTTNQFSQIAESIGKGDYNVIVPLRGEDDLLGKALDSMRINLQKLHSENQQRNWLLSGNALLNEQIRGEKNVKKLAGDVIHCLCNYMNVKLGAIYLNEGGELKLCGSYAYEIRKQTHQHFLSGEGLVGQSALEQKPILFTEVPENYVTIHSGLGKISPKQILVYPIIYQEETKAVLEIGSHQEFNATHMELMKTVSESIAIGIHVAQSRDKLRELLEETQRQSEELEAQQEELRKTNEELTAKTELLEHSEAEMKAQQGLLQQTNEELEEKAKLLEDQKENLENAKMELENKARELEITSKYKSEFLANMSHELRTPLNSVLILSQLLMDNKSRNLGEREKEFAKTIYSSGTDLLNLINEILDLSKVESGKMELEIGKVSIQEMVSHTQTFFTEIMKNKSIRFSIDIKQENCPSSIESDKIRIEQVIKNLLSNAVKFTPEGGEVKLSIYSASKEVPFRNHELKNQEVLALSVSDTGIGIPVEKQSVIFEAFQQADGSTKRKYGGTGLGLSISREIAGILGGEIHLNSEPGKGAVFTLYLPVNFSKELISGIEKKVGVTEKKPSDSGKVFLDSEHDLEEENVPDDKTNLSDEDKLVVIIEDDRNFAEMILKLVREKKYKGLVALKGNTGLNLVKQYKPSAVILDLKLPVMDGTEVLHHIKNDPLLRHIPVQVISGYDKRKQAMEMGAFDFIFKPVTKDQFYLVFDKMENFIKRKIKQLLVIEDNKHQTQAICELIGNGDVICTCAYSGAEAMSFLKKQTFDCIILDLGLPDISGFDLLEKIKEISEYGNIPVIIYTAKELTKPENTRLARLADTVVLKTVNSYDRLLDETTLFLHRVESKLPSEKQHRIRHLHKADEILTNKKVLIVDDDMRNVYSLVNLLEEEGVICFTAENGKIALQTLRDHPDIAMVLMDVMMPEMDGYEATKEIRKMVQYQKLPILGLTAKAMLGDRERCLASGMSDYIAKPVDVEKLVSLMRVWLYS